MATYDGRTVRIKKAGTCHPIDNTERKFGSSGNYYAVKLRFDGNIDGEAPFLCDSVYLFTHAELDKAAKRALLNPEDIPEMGRLPWWTRVRYFLGF